MRSTRFRVSTPSSFLYSFLALATVLAAPPTLAADSGQTSVSLRAPNRPLPGSRRPDSGPIPDLDLSGSSSAVDPRLRNLSRSAAGARFVHRGPSGEDEVGVLVQGSVSTEALQAAGARVNTTAGDIRTARVPLSALSRVLQLPGVRRVSLGYGLRPQLDVSVPETHADHKRADSPPLWGWNGTGVIVGIVDTGMDYRHDDFKDPNGKTRFLSIWDQNTLGSPPMGFSYGNECTQTQLNQGTCTESDVNGHGSHVTGIAAGDGSATGNLEPQFVYVGMANNANLIGVATDFSVQGVVDGVNYVFQKALTAGKPAVVNLSLGTDLGPHDGTTPLDISLNNLTGPGKIIVSSAGNAESDTSHASLDVPGGGGVKSITFATPSYTASAGAGNDFVAIDLWHAAANSYAVRIKRPSSSTLLGPVAKGNISTFSTTDGQVIVDYRNTNDPGGNGQAEIYVEINDGLGTPPRSAGAWRIDLTPVSVPGNAKVHAWMESALGDNALIAKVTANYDSTMNVSSPASADSLIAVAAYTSKRFWASVDGNIYNFIGSVDPFQICPFSAHGPRRDGVAKPDIAAPGSAVGSVLSGDSAPPWPLPLIAPDGVHLILQGTSMSSPHVTGAVAMLLQKYPTLSPKGMKLLLASGARSDTTTGAVPNPVWGAGKLNLESLLCSDVQAPALANGFPLAGDALYKGTTVGLNWTASDDRLVESIDLAYRIGFLGSFTTIANGEQNDSYYEWTVPNILTDSLQIRVIARDCVSSVTSLGPFVPVRAPSTDVGGDLPVAFATYHPRPNPFTQSSAIRFDVPTSAKSGWPVEVSIHNVAGRLVRTIVKGELPPGRYSFDWNGRDESGAQMGAGIYFLSINAGPNQARDRLIYLR